MSAPPSPTGTGLGAKEWALLLLLGLVWGSSFFFFAVLVRDLPPFTVVFGRLVVAAAALNLIARSRRDWRPIPPGRWPDYLVLGAIANAVPFSLIAFGETRITSGLASILNAATPVFSVLVAHAFTRDERLNWNRGLGVVLGFLGVVVLVGPSALASGSKASVAGELACLGAALVYGFAAVYSRRFRGAPPLQVATGQVTASAAVVTPFALVFDRPWSLAPPPLQTWAALFGLALLCTAFAYILFFHIMRTAGAVNVTVVTFLAPVSAILLGVLFLGEPLSLRALFGLAIVGLGLAALDGRPLAHARAWLERRAVVT